MHPRRRRLAVAAVALILMLAVAAAVQPRPAPVYTFRITFGLLDRQPTVWNGRVGVAGGEVIHLEGWHFQNRDRIQGTQGWICQTHDLIAPGHSYPVTTPHQQPPATLQQPWRCGVTVSLRGGEPMVALTLRQGEIKFAAADVLLSQPRRFLDGQVEVQRMPNFSVVRPPAPASAVHPFEDDYPSLWVDKDGRQTVAWVAYRDSGDRVLLSERNGSNQPWSAPMMVDGPGDHFRVALTGQGKDKLWITWSAQKQHRWQLYARPFTNGKLGAIARLTDDACPNLWHRMAIDSRGRAWLVWQGFRKGHSHIFARYADATGWHDAIQISDGQDNQWDPAIAADPRSDRVWIAWDGYNGQTYNVHVRSLTTGAKPQLGAIQTPEPSPLFEAHASITCDNAGRVWAAWDEAGPQWGKDYGFLDFANNYRPGTRLYASRRVRIKCLQENRWLEPAAPLADALPLAMRDFYELPQLQADDEGRLWLIFRHRTCRYPREDGWAMMGRWDIFATAFLGDGWLPPTELPESGGRLDMRTSSVSGDHGHVWLAYATDHRPWVPPLMLPRNQSLTVADLHGAPPAKPARLVERHEPMPAVMPVHPREREQVARIRRYKIEAGGKTYHIYRGDIHRHTDISADGAGDGSLTDLHRYALDAAAMDYIFVTDHNMGQNNEYCWWRTQKANDLYTVPGSFISMYGYERSMPYPHGHRNIIWTERGFRTLPLPNFRDAKAMAEDTTRLYAYLRRTNGICTSHTSATDQGTNWKEHDDRLEPVVEIFQGYHASYEAPNAPKTVNDETPIVHGAFRPDGFVSHGLARGYHLGFQASSDHISTHTSYACILAEEFSRVGLARAIKQRHTYAATDNIVLDVRTGQLGIMGDEVKTSEPRLDIVVLGTGPLDRVDILRNSVVVATRPGQGEEMHWQWKDPAPLRGGRENYYYVRVMQKDGQMAWASPIWVQSDER